MLLFQKVQQISNNQKWFRPWYYRSYESCSNSHNPTNAGTFCVTQREGSSGQSPALLLAIPGFCFVVSHVSIDQAGLWSLSVWFPFSYRITCLEFPPPSIRWDSRVAVLQLSSKNVSYSLQPFWVINTTYKWADEAWGVHAFLLLSEDLPLVFALARGASGAV